MNANILFILISSAMVSGILSFVLVLILWWSTIFSASNESQLLLPNRSPFSRKDNCANEEQGTQKRLLKEQNETIEILENENINTFNNTISWKWLTNIAAPSLLITILAVVVLLTIGLTETTNSSKYLYITYFKDYNFTITIQVTHSII